MTVEPVQEGDAPRILELAKKWGQDSFFWDPRSWGIVVRDKEGTIHGFAVLCRRSDCVYVEEIWTDTTLSGKRAMLTIFAHCEDQSQAAGYMPCAIVKLESPMYAMLKKRGYVTWAHVMVRYDHVSEKAENR
jgi:hypothetical protein